MTLTIGDWLCNFNRRWILHCNVVDVAFGMICSHVSQCGPSILLGTGKCMVSGVISCGVTMSVRTMTMASLSRVAEPVDVHVRNEFVNSRNPNGREIDNVVDNVVGSVSLDEDKFVECGITPDPNTEILRNTDPGSISYDGAPNAT